MRIKLRWTGAGTPHLETTREIDKGLEKKERIEGTLLWDKTGSEYTRKEKSGEPSLLGIVYYITSTESIAFSGARKRLTCEAKENTGIIRSSTGKYNVGTTKL